METESNHLELAKNLVANGKEYDHVIEQLKKHGASDEDAMLFTNQARKSYCMRKRKRGFALGLIGIVLLFSGFFLTVFLFHADKSIDITLYGMTSSGAILLLLGMIDVLGW
ncbi:MAG: hypothetical protein ACKOX7_06605 [Bacteroidota bacterium]